MRVATVGKALALTSVAALLGVVPAGGWSTGGEPLLTPYLPTNAHAAYGYLLALDGFARPGVRDWVEAAEDALRAPEKVAVPLVREGRLGGHDGTAVALTFTAPQARKVLIEIESEADDPAHEAQVSQLFADLYLRDGGLAPIDSAAPRRSADGVLRQRFELALFEPTDYVLRLQSEIGYAGRYRVSISTSPLLTFPVDGFGMRAIQSFFGAERDGGSRQHRGVDVFAPRGTPALAAMDARVVRVETTPRGGNVVWLNALFDGVRLYYAHLDSQSVEVGDIVLAGDPVGTVGNTGNAITTPPHLHFGVYLRRPEMRGAHDPYPFLE